MNEADSSRLDALGAAQFVYLTLRGSAVQSNVYEGRVWKVWMGFILHLSWFIKMEII